jgi:molybdenum cofactor cytidylyltransferase
MVDSRIAAVILAAGGSTRLGEPKQLVTLGSRPLISYVLDTVRETRVDARYVVLGHTAETIRQHVCLDGFREIYNADFADGQSTSVARAVQELSADTSAVIFVLGDQPLQNSAVIDRIADSYRTEPAPIIQPSYREGPGNPVLFDRSLFPNLTSLTGDSGARPILKSNPELIRRIDCTDFSRPLDVDTPEDVEHIRAIWSEIERKVES